MEETIYFKAWKTVFCRHGVCAILIPLSTDFVCFPARGDFAFVFALVLGLVVYQVVRNQLRSHGILTGFTDKGQDE